MTSPNNAYQSGVRFRAYPDTAVAATLRQWIGCQRVIYNAKVEEDRLFAAQRRLELSSGKTDVVPPLDQQYSHFKDNELTPWLSQVPSQLLRNGAVRWMSAKQRQLKGLARAPRRRNRRNFNSVLLTSELFRFQGDGGKTVLELGTVANPVGALRFKAHRPYALPKQIVVREEAGHWFVSFSYEHHGETVQRLPHELAYELNNLDDAVLREGTLGLDRNVKDNCIAASNGTQYRLDAAVVERMRRKEVGARRQQRRLARCQKGSANRKKQARRLARKRAYAAAAREDFAHKVSHALSRSENQFFVLEALNIQGMTKRARAKQDSKTGKWLPNGRRAKAGLNKAILESCWGSIHRKLTYKAARHNKLVGLVPAAYSSQECSRCGHTHPDNRHEQRFACLRCGFGAHADTNAACVIKQRGLTRLREGVYEQVKSSKRTAFQRKSSKTTDGLSAHVCGASVRPAR